MNGKAPRIWLADIIYHPNLCDFKHVIPVSSLSCFIYRPICWIVRLSRGHGDDRRWSKPALALFIIYRTIMDQIWRPKNSPGVLTEHCDPGNRSYSLTNAHTCPRVYKVVYRRSCFHIFWQSKSTTFVCINGCTCEVSVQLYVVVCKYIYIYILPHTQSLYSVTH